MHTGKNKQSFFQVWKYNSTIRKLHISSFMNHNNANHDKKNTENIFPQKKISPKYLIYF